jgi:hypothetical protein
VTSLEAALRRACTDLESTGHAFALAGGLAVSVRTEPRFTRDADLLVAVSGDAEAERLIYELRRRGYETEAVVEQEAVGRLATARLTLPEDPSAAVVDLLFASSGIEGEIVADAELLEVLPRLRLPVARTGHLIALKVLARDDEARPQDFVDLRALLRVASAEELTRARAALNLISERGYHRGRDLSAQFMSLMAR